MKRYTFLFLMLALACQMTVAQRTYPLSFWDYYTTKENWTGLPSNEFFFRFSLDDNGNGIYDLRWIDRDVSSFTWTEAEHDSLRLYSRVINDVSDEERAALMAFYNATDGPNWTRHDNWGTDKPVKDWYGVSVTKNYDSPSHVVVLELNENNLKGELPDLSSLSELNTVMLDDNYLEGNIPDLSSLKKLGYFSVRNNRISGFPAWNATSQSLYNFVIDNNQIEDFPEIPCRSLLSLDGFYFYRNYLKTIPKWAQEHDMFHYHWTQFCNQKNVDASIIDGVRIPAPVFRVTDTDGVLHTSSEEYKKHKYTLLLQWATWCPYSKPLVEKLNYFYRKYQSQGFHVLGLTWGGSSETLDGVLDYCSTNGITWPNVFTENGKEWDLFFDGNDDLRLTLSGGVFPRVYFVDSEGTLLFQDSYFNYHTDIYPLLEELIGPIPDIKTEYYTSTDYSKDGEVTKLQSATKGKGVDLVLIGEGFVDKDMESGGKYEQRMRSAMEQFFSEEPLASLRDRFNVWMVKAVSPNAELLDDAIHAIDKDDGKAFEYAKKALGNDAERIMVNVVYNITGGIDRSFCRMRTDGSYVAYIMDSSASVIVHEAGGHGVGQLYDEYVETTKETDYSTAALPEDKKAWLDEAWTNYGIGANVDYHSNPADVKWARFLTDDRYAGEYLGVYEGAYLYGKGAYRPSQNSMMRYGDAPFNAPSREAIYKKVMQYSEPDWTYDYETFVEFDAPGRAAAIEAQKAASRSRRAMPLQRTPPRQPEVIKGSWRDALKKAK